MKIFSKLIIVFLTVFIACEKPLQEETFSTLGPTNFYNSAEDAETLLNGVYATSQGYRDILRDYLTFGEATTDIFIERRGAINALIQPVENFNWSATHPWLDRLWGRYYRGIYRANVVLDKVPAIDMDEERKQQILAEARFLRAFNYYYLNDLFGPVPIITTSETSVDARPSRPTEGEFNTFVENEFLAVSEVLPKTQAQFGRATKGAALGFLTKFYLNNKKWAEAAETAKKVMDLGVYSLFTAGNRTELFALSNEGNSEFIYVAPFPDNPTGALGNTYLSHTAPDGYQWKWPPKVIFAADFRIRSEFLELFEPEDERLDAFVFEYINKAGELVQLEEDNVRSFKYPEDPAGVGNVSGNDFPLLRYADILLSRAEALNELNGPNPESIALINEIRTAAGVAPISLADYPSKEALNAFILDERGREFHTEALRRQDLIRHGVFIEMARERGIEAFDYQVLFPIPQSELDKNPNLVQNEGY
ncbi:MAG TPA: RagB/SusD family nutrient uptake outer membrane protein [Salinimicrobium sp.]|nr:RagB/SusD family nutrient uptake outer membrane protein [Salinimicrobium sp.]